MNIDLASPEILKLKLPSFRDDLEIYPGPTESDGSPTYNVFDPITAQFYKISWGEAKILEVYRPGMLMGDLLKVLAERTTLKVSPEQVVVFFEDAARNNLTLSFRSSESLWLQKEARKINPLKWLLYHYLYIRVPILSPDRFLTRTLPYIKKLFSPLAFKIFLATTLMGLFILLTQFDRYIHTFPYFFNLKGAFYYVLAIFSIKIIHEFSHAYTAKRFGIRVPTMGIAFIVLWPVLYTDVTDSWKLSKRSERLGISIAGITSELVLAGICTLGWALTDPGPLQSIFFIVSSTTWVTSILINLNPAMRWDGYYLLCDLWGIDNLQPRSFAITRWRIRKWLWGLNVPPPEEGFSTKREVGLIIYTFYTWIYRLILYTAVAIFVYTVFAKVLGIFLFLLEVGVFIVAPFVSEAKQLFKLRKSMTLNFRSITTCIILGILLLWFIVPLPHSQSFTAVTVPVNEQVVYVPDDGVIEEIYVKQNDLVTIGQPLILLASQRLESEIEQKLIEKKILEEQIRILGGLDRAKEKIPEKAAEWEAANNLLNSLIKKNAMNVLSAEVNGLVYYWDDNLHIYQSLPQNKIVGRIGDLNKIKVVCFVPEKDLKGIETGQRANFQLRVTGQVYPGTIANISPVKSSRLLYPQLASIHGGDLPVVDKGAQSASQTALIMVESYYQVDLDLDPTDVPLRIGQVGDLDYRGKWYSIFGDLMKQLFNVLIKESNF